jgi:hypothetical protein
MNRPLPMFRRLRASALQRGLIASAVLAALAAGLTACGGRDDADAPLAYVPADTPYVFANLEPLDGDVVASWSELMEPMRAAFADTLAHARAKLQKSGDDPEATQRILSVMDLFEDKLSLEGWERIGFSREARMAIYGVGVLPVMRVELRDPDALRAFFGEIETRSGHPWPTAQAGEHTYWRFAPDADKPMAFVIAILDEHLVMTLDPGGDEAQLSSLLGLTRPENTLVDSDVLEQVNEQYGFGPHGTAIVDSRRLAAALLGSEGQETWITRQMAAEGKPLSAACRTELTAMAELAPRMVAGYTRIDEKHMDSNTVIELRQDLAQGLIPVAAPVPGLGSSAGSAAAEFGFGIRLDKLAEFLQARASAVRAAPYACEHLAGLNTSAEQMGQQMAGLYMAAGWFTGMRAVLTELTFADETSTTPENIEGALVIASPNPAGLLGMVKGFVPQLAAVELVPGAAPVQVDLAEMAGASASDVPVPPTWIAMSDSAIALAAGNDAGATLPGHLGAAAPEPAPLLHMSYEGAFYGRTMRRIEEAAIASAAADDDEVIFQPDVDAAEEGIDEDAGADAAPEAADPANPYALAGSGVPDAVDGEDEEDEFTRMLQPFITSAYAMYDGIDYTAVDVVATERGIEMRQVVQLK